MNSAVENDPLRDDQSGDGFAPRAQGALVTTVFLVLGVVVAAMAPDGTWWRPVLLVGAGMGAMGGLYWIRARQQRRAAARTNVLRVEKQVAASRASSASCFSTRNTLVRAAARRC
jgi:protein-S-isoprenylcysteine O-methyltransferase Ste14